MFINIYHRLLLLSITIHGIHGNHGKPSNQISHKWTVVSRVKYQYFLQLNRNDISATDSLQIHNIKFHEIQPAKWQANCSAKMVLKLGRSGQHIRNAWKVFKCGAGEGWRRPVGPIMW